MSVERISSPIIITPQGQSFSALEINGDGFEVVNAAEERDSTGQTYPAGSQSVISVRPDTGSTINASYIKTGVIDANLMRAGLIQTVPSWNTKWYGAPADHAAVQMGFTGGSIAATAVSTGSGTVSLTLPGGHGLITGDYVRVSGLYFTTGTLLGGVGLNLPTNDPLDYASATVATNTLTYSKSDITSGLTASTASTVYVGKAFAISSVDRAFDDPDNPAELSTVTVTTSSAHGFSVGDYIELTGTIETLDGVAYVTSVPTSTTFTFKQRFGDDISFDGASTGISLPTLGTPAAIKVLKSYTQNADGSIHITSGTVDSTLIVGEISATEITIGSGESVVRVGNYPDAISPTFQGIWAGSANPATAEFSVNTAGALSATSGTIGGYTLASDRLTNLSTGATPRHAGLIDTAADDGLAFFAGATSTAGAGATFSVTNSGDVTAADLTVTGGSIDIGNFTLSTLGNITEKLVIEQKFITNENGVDLISTSSDGGSAYALSKAISDGIYTGIQNGSFGSPTPTLASNINNTTNALPYWTYADGGSANKPYAQVVTSATAASGHVVRFTIPASAAVGDYAYLERYVAVPGSYARSYTYQPRAAWANRSASDTTIMVYQDAQFFTNATSGGVPTTKTGLQGAKQVVVTAVVNNTTTLEYTYTADANNTIAAGDTIFVRGSSLSQYNIGTPDNPITVDSATATTFTVTQSVASGSPTFTNGFARTYPGAKLLSALSTSWGTETWSNPGSTRSNGAVPESAAYLRIRVGVLVGTTVGASSRTIDLSEVRLDKGPIQLQLVDQVLPDTYGYGDIWLSSGTLTIAPNEAGLNGGSNGTNNPRIELQSSGDVVIRPSSTGALKVISKPTGGSTAAVPLMVYGLPSQTGNLQQWINNTSGGTVLASVASDGAFRIQPNSTGIASLVSTTHPFQIGQTSATNLRMDTNQIMAVSNGSASDLYLNSSGGDVHVGNTGPAGDLVLGSSATSVDGALIFKTGTGGSIRAFSATSGNTSIAIKNSSGSAYAALVADTFFPGGQGSKYLDYNGVNFTLNAGLDVTGAVDGTTFYSSSGTYAVVGSSGGDVSLTGADVTVPISGNGELQAIPNTTTLTTNSARWVLTSGNIYALRRDSSTRRVKTNIVEADDAVLAAAKNLRAVHYEALEKDDDGNVVPSGKHTLGLIAEEIVEAGLGCAVTYDGEGLPDGYDERVIIAALLHRVNDLESRLAELETGA